ncbi:MAG: aldo/keto reductase [Chloroflexi bacterium]|nr:aldo/keto reductase [Chloroflexota bacterium]MBP7045359.1 aldo/keto reductase [Chloroflexota bacterium]
MIPKLSFGRTAHMSTRTLFGAFAVGFIPQVEADRVLDLLLSYGINHIDTAHSYGDAELRLGPWMKRHRQDFFLATKTEQRTYRGAWDELRQSLERMQTDHIDLWQMHLLVDPDEWDVAMGPGGALEAFIEAREQGLVRYLGVTGHGVTVAQMHLRSLARFDFDSVLLPYNYSMMQNSQYAADFAALTAVCAERHVAIQTIKSLARGSWGAKPQTRNTWYEPFEKEAEIETAVHWVLNRPDIFLNTAGDPDLLPLVLAAASRFTPANQAGLDRKMAQLQAAPLFT